MKKVIIYILLLFAGLISLASGVEDKNQVLTNKEKIKLEKICEEIYNNHGLQIYLYLLDEGHDKPYMPAVSGRDSYLYAFINLEKRTVQLEMRKVPENFQVFHQQVFIQWVEIFLQENRSISEGLTQALWAIDREYRNTKLVIEQDLGETYSEPDEFTKRTRILVDFFKTVFIIFVALFTLKGFRSGNQYEIVEYYGLSRLTGKVKIASGVLFLGITAYSMYLVIPYEELAVVYVGLAFTAYPFMVGLGLLIKIPEDIYIASKLEKEQHSLSLGQIAYLGNRRTATEHLMEFTFYEAVFNQSINLIITSYEHMHREVVEFHVQKGELKGKTNADVHIFAKKLPSEPIKLSTYLKEIYTASGRFKAYRKDVLIKPLAAAGYIHKWSWVLNLFILSHKGAVARNKIKQKIAQQDKLISHGLLQPENLKKVLPKLDKYCLLVDDFETRLTELHNMIVEMELTTFALQQPIGILFDYRLSLRTFNSHLKAAYFYRLPWSWNDHDANESE